MKIFDLLLKEISDRDSKKDEQINSLESFIKSMSAKLLADDFYPSKSLKNLLDKYLKRAKYPMEVAVVGQFSSGKSTFLNALLSKDVLPTGITPVTSKVNFLNYADEYKLKITFDSGAKEFHDIEHLAKFTDQREATSDIKYLTIYAPVPMLKEISFVDTPGLNSQSKFDTNTTNTVLRDVDGIIWLGLIDAVAKKSELDILEKYIPNYANKSICLLNQKDRLSSSEIDTALEYAKKNYKDFFSDIVAISAEQALDSRIHQKDTLLFNEKKRFISEINDDILSSQKDIDDNFLSKSLKKHSSNVKNIQNKDFSHHLENLEDSNILKVLEFIDEVLRPQAKEAKVFAIKKDLSSLCEILQNEYTRITTVYADLSEILDDFSNNLRFKLNELDKEISLHVERINIKLLENIDENVNQIYLNIKPVKKYLAKEKKSLLGVSCKKEEYQSYYLDNSSSKNINIKESIDALDELVVYVISEMKNVLNNFEKELLLWQMKNEKLQKNREVASDTEFYNIRHFATAIYEHIAKDFVGKFDDFKSVIQAKVYKLSLKSRFDLAYEKTILQIMLQLINMEKSYEKNSESSVINNIDESEILLIFKENLNFEYLKRELMLGDSFIRASVNEYDKEVSKVVDISTAKIHTYFDSINSKVKLLDSIKSDINTKFTL